MTVEIVAVLSVVALALDYMRSRKLDEWMCQRHEDRLRANEEGLHEQARRVDQCFHNTDAHEERVRELEAKIGPRDS